MDFREQELNVISIMGKLGEKVTINQLIKESNLSDSAIMRAALVL